VAKKGADPVACPLAQHGVAILAARDEKKGAVVLDRGEGKMGDGAGVPCGDEGFRCGPESKNGEKSELTLILDRHGH
jgi:hypothetical protein